MARDRAFSHSIDARIIALLRAHSGGRYLDVGCGTGDHSRSVAEIAGAAGKVVGIDTDSAAIALARQQGGPAIEFLVADAHRLCFPDGSFDGCRAERLLQHVDDTFQVVAEMARITVAGGAVAVCEPDWGTAVIHGGDPDLSRAVLHAWGSSLRHGFVGRALPALFRQAGLVDVAVEPFTAFTTLHGYRSVRGQQEWDLAVGAGIAKNAGAVSAAAAEKWLDQLDAAVRQGSFFMALTCFLVKGRKV